MSDPARPKRSKPRKESGMHGKHYERKLFALTALKCLFDENIKDFWLLSNPSEIDKFDDIVLWTVSRSGEKKLFMIQAKHRLQGTDRPLPADKLDGPNKDLSLKMYQEAFFEIKGNEDFFEINDICEETEIICILFNNCKVNQTKLNENISFHSDYDNCFQFIDTSKNTGILTITNKTEKYDQNFLDRFYFYTEQLNEESINNEIGKLLGVNEDIVQTLLTFFYSWVDREHDCIKLTKLDLKTKLMDILLGDFQPPRDLNSVNSPKLINVINKFNATVITEENSSKIVWSEIFHEIQQYCESFTLKSTDWGECISPDKAEEKFQDFRDKDTLLMNNKGITIKLAYIFLVVQRKIPFFITTNNRLFESFKSKLLHALDVYSVVYKVHRESISFLDVTKVFQNLSDMEDGLYFRHSKQLKVSFQGKADTDLYGLIKDKHNIRLKFSVDNYIELLHEKCIVGEANTLPKYYVNRKIRVPLIKKEILTEKKFNFFIFQCPRLMTPKSPNGMEIGTFSVNIYGDLYESHFITTTPDEFDTKYSPLMLSLSKNRVYFIFKYITKDYFLLLDTNGSIDTVRSYLIYESRKDVQFYNIHKNCNINIICNNAGMGKSTFLTFIHSKLSADEWVIHLDLKKCIDRIKTIKTMEELISFSYNSQDKNVSDSFGIFFEMLYENLKHKIFWLIDGYEEVNQPVLLNLFRSAARKGFRIWIVGRQQLKSTFENVFRVFSMELLEFNKEDQQMFTEKYLKEKNKSEVDIRKIMTAIGKIRNLLEDSFIGICQQTMMLTEIFLNYDRSWKEHEWRTHDIYEKFINLKISDSYGVQKEWYLRTISKLALKVFFKDDALKTVFDLEEFEEDVHIFRKNYPKDYFISEFVENDVPFFSHRTYAEFLAARWLLHTVRKQMNGDTPFNISGIFAMLHLKELTGVRLFFDNMTTKHLPFHCAIVNREDKNRVLANEYFSETDLIGRSVFHLVSSHGNYFDIGVTTESTNLVRNLDTHSQVVRKDQFILLKPIRSRQSDNRDANIMRYLQKLPFLNRIIAIAKEDNLLKLNPIYYALMSGSLLELDALLSFRNLAVNQSALTLPSEEMRYCVLFHCIRNNYKNILYTLDVKDLNNVKIDPSKESFLHLAVSSKNLEAVKKLTQHHPLEHWGVDNQGNTPLHIACNQSDDAMLKYLSTLVHDVDVGFLNRKNDKGETHLHFLARRGHNRWIKKIIKVPGVSIDSEDCNGNTPFLLSVMFHKILTASLLRSGGANVNHANNKKMTALHYASSKGFLKCVEKLLLWGADVNVRDNLGNTPLMKASWEHKKVVVLLLSNKAKINLCNNKKWTALHVAVRKNNIEVIELLLKCKAGVKRENRNSETPLVIACKNNFVKATELLLDSNVTLGRKHALKISIRKDHKECIDLLFQAGVTL